MKNKEPVHDSRVTIFFIGFIVGMVIAFLVAFMANL